VAKSLGFTDIVHFLWGGLQGLLEEQSREEQPKHIPGVQRGAQLIGSRRSRHAHFLAKASLQTTLTLACLLPTSLAPALAADHQKTTQPSAAPLPAQPREQAQQVNLSPALAAIWRQAINDIDTSNAVALRRRLADQPWLRYHVQHRDGTLLHYAASTNAPMTQALITAGVDIFRRNGDGTVATATAIDEDARQIWAWYQQRVDRLLKRDSHKDTSSSIFTAVQQGTPAEIPQKIDKKGRRATTQQGLNLLHVAAIQGNPQSITRLLKAHVSERHRDKKRRLPVQIAIEHNHLDAARALINKRAPSGRELRRLLQIAINKEDHDLATLLLEQHKNRKEAQLSYHLQIIAGTDSAYLLEASLATLPERDSQQMASYFKAALEKRRVNILASLLRTKPNLATATTPPAMILMSQHPPEDESTRSIIELLLKHGASCSQTTTEGFSIIDYWIAQGINPATFAYAPTDLPQSPTAALLPALQSDQPDDLPKKTDQLKMRFPLQRTLAHVLVEWGAARCIEQVWQKLDWHQYDHEGYQPLHLLPQTPTERQYQTAQALLATPTRFNVSTWSGKTLLDLISANEEHQALRDLLIANGAVSSQELVEQQSRGQPFEDL
jgi:ankyrin repeat protein